MTQEMSDFMSKINIHYHFTNNNQNIEKQLKGIKKDKEISFYDEDVLFKILYYDELILKRITSEYELEINFDKKEAIYQVKALGNIKLNVKLLDKKVNENTIKIHYQIEEENILLELNYEVIE
jgi:hypothetical protein